MPADHTEGYLTWEEVVWVLSAKAIELYGSEAAFMAAPTQAADVTTGSMSPVQDASLTVAGPQGEVQGTALKYETETGHAVVTGAVSP